MRSQNQCFDEREVSERKHELPFSAIGCKAILLVILLYSVLAVVLHSLLSFVYSAIEEVACAEKNYQKIKFHSNINKKDRREYNSNSPEKIHLKVHGTF